MLRLGLRLEIWLIIGRRISFIIYAESNRLLEHRRLPTALCHLQPHSPCRLHNLQGRVHRKRPQKALTLPRHPFILLNLILRVHQAPLRRPTEPETKGNLSHPKSNLDGGEPQIPPEASIAIDDHHDEGRRQIEASENIEEY